MKIRSALLSAVLGTACACFPNLAEAQTGAAPVITSQLVSSTVPAGTTVVLSATVTGSQPLNYEWLLNGSVLAVSAELDSGTVPSGSTSDAVISLPLDDVGPLSAGIYTLIVSNSFGSVTSNPATLVVTTDAYLTNFSARAQVSANNPLVVGLMVRNLVPPSPGDDAPNVWFKQLLFRGIGPGLATTFNVPEALGSTQLTLSGGTGPLVTNAGWTMGLLGGTAIPAQAATAASMSAVGAFPLLPGSADSAFAAAVPAGAYTTQTAGVNGEAGIALSEVFVADTPISGGALVTQLANASARALVGVGNSIFIGGFVVGGTTAESLLIRAVGPGLGSFGLTGVLPNPQLTICDASGKPVPFSVNGGGWSGSASFFAAVSAQVGAFPLADGSRDAALVITLPPGAYTAEVSDQKGATGLALLEFYDVR